MTIWCIVSGMGNCAGKPSQRRDERPLLILILTGREASCANSLTKRHHHYRRLGLVNHTKSITMLKATTIIKVVVVSGSFMAMGASKSHRGKFGNSKFILQLGLLYRRRPR